MNPLVPIYAVVMLVAFAERSIAADEVAAWSVKGAIEIVKELGSFGALLVVGYWCARAIAIPLKDAHIKLVESLQTTEDRQSKTLESFEVAMRAVEKAVDKIATSHDTLVESNTSKMRYLTKISDTQDDHGKRIVEIHEVVVKGNRH